MTRDYSFTKHRIFQWMGILLALGIIAVGYWWYQSQASTLNKSPTGSLTSGLVGYWTFDGADTSSTTATDRSGNSNTGTLTNGPTTTEGKVGQALSFDGVNDYVAVASSPSLTFGSSPHTVSFWFKVNTAFNSSSATSVPLITRRDSDDVNFSCTLRGTDYANGSGSAGTMQIKYESQSAVAAVYWHTTQNSWAANVWYHVVIIINTDGTNSNVYINGVAAKGGSSGGTTIYDTNYASEWRLGRGDFDTASNLSGVKYLSGSLDEARIYNTALTATQIQSLYALGQSDKTNSSVSQPQGTGRLDSGLAGYWALDNGSGTSATDSSTNGNTGTLTNGPTWTTGQIGGAVSFDGTDDYLYISSAAPLAIGVGSKVSTSFWYTANVSNGTTQTIYQRAGGACSQYVANITGGASTDTLIFYYRDNGCGGIDGYSVSSITKNTWHHVVSTYDTITGVLSVYVDGVRVATTTSVPSSSISDGVTLTIGAGQGGTNFFGGTLDEFRFYNRILSADEVSQLYRLTAPTGVDTSLKGYWSFNAQDMSSTTAYDRSGAGNTGTLTNGPAIAEGKLGQALSFDGSDDYVSVNNSFGYANTTFTACAWIKTTSASNEVIVSQQNNVASTYGGWNLGVNNNTTNKFGIILKESSGNNPYTVASNTSVNDGQWHHTCAVITTSTTVSANNTALLYVDGVNDQASPVLDGSRVYTATTDSLRIGSRVGSSGSPVQLFAGSIDEVRIYNTALTAAQIKALYDAGQSDKQNSSVSQPQGTGRLDSGLAGYWPLDNGSGTSATDGSVNASNGTLTNGPTWTIGQIGGAVNFDGTDDYIVSSSSINFASLSFTVAGWAKRTSTGTYDIILGNGTYSGDSTVLQFGFNNLDKLMCSFFANDLATSLTYTDSNWHHWVCAYNATTNFRAIYLDGVLVASDTAPIDYLGSGVIYLGDDSGVGSSGSFSGQLDELRIYNRALSTDEISQLYRLTSPTGVDTSLKGYWSFNGKDMSGTTAYDRSGAGNNGTLTNGPTITEGKLGQALSFDGTDDYVSVPSSTSIYPSLPLTFSFWVKPNTVASAQGVFGAREAVQHEGYWAAINSDGSIGISYGDWTTCGSGGRRTKTSAASALVAGQWQHVVGILRGATDMTIYVNGTDVGGTYSGTGGTITYSALPILRLGAVGGSGGCSATYLNGSLDEARLYNRALSAGEVAALYNAGR